MSRRRTEGQRPREERRADPIVYMARAVVIVLLLIMTAGTVGLFEEEDRRVIYVSADQSVTKPDGAGEELPPAQKVDGGGNAAAPSTDKAPDKGEGGGADPDPAPPVAEGGSFNLRFLDVGQADAALVECDGRYMLIDGGNKGDSSLIYTVLKNEGAEYLDIVVASHAHEDHVGGLPAALSFARAGLVLCPVTEYDTEAFRDFVTYADKNGGITVPQVGDSYSLGSARVTVLAVNSSDDDNDASIYLKIQYGKTAFLFTGDGERGAEQVLLDSGADLSATVLKVGHHGAAAATTYPFLRAVQPEYAVISVGANNDYGHPTDETLSRLSDAGVTVCRTDLHGEVRITSDGETLTVALERED